ncbi:hypothetical protein [Winogradskyella tangerina]|uniref:hypothetical protein n=1 Tax=Winogradskyella tangerina TaxID=2023240 RepID=UPI000DBE9D79|nr:hypothetical protein [Winogradskyella tangerina]
MKKFPLIFLLLIQIVSCKDSNKNTDLKSAKSLAPEIAKIQEENFDLRNDSVIFSSGTIENFDKDGKSIDVYWLGEDKDTILRFYRKYDSNKNLIGAEYFEAGDTEPSRDTVYTNSEGRKVEASLNSDNQITWRSTITEDENGNPVLKTYSNGKGQYRGLDSLFFDSENRVIKGFYENSKGKRYSIRTYKYLNSDEHGNWIERQMFKNDTLNQKQVRTITYH